MIEVSNISLALDAGLPDGEPLVYEALSRALGIKKADIGKVQLLKRSVDARKRNNVHFVATYAVSLLNEQIERALLAGERNVSKQVHVKPHTPYEPLAIKQCKFQQVDKDGFSARPVVVGTGPAGLFAALYLARAGLRPIVVERGGTVEERRRAVDAFDKGKPLDRESNIQFGEGGAGTFSDGKLTTGTHSSLVRHVLQWFVDAGAPSDILWQAKPHIGTDKLVSVVRNMREEIEREGGTVLFHAKLSAVSFDQQGSLQSLEVTAQDAADICKRLGYGEVVLGGSTAKVSSLCIPCTTLVLACGHSARDTFGMLRDAQLAMEQKSFSVGVRIEHRQEDIDKAQYGSAAMHPALESADYKLVVHLPDGRSVYSFCMCPGGTVVAAASEEFGVVVNGMSTFARDGVNANAALLVNVTPADLQSGDVLAGIAFQRRIEQAAYGEVLDMGGTPWQAPAQTVGDFLADEAGHASDRVFPSYSRGVVWCDLREVLPSFVTTALAEALPLFDKKLRGFAHEQAVLTGVETRSSSPVRILRDPESLQAWRQTPRKRVRARDIARGHGRPQESSGFGTPCGIYPCGEGAGYAGGIVSAAVDGLRVAQAIVNGLTNRLER